MTEEQVIDTDQDDDQFAESSTAGETPLSDEDRQAQEDQDRRDQEATEAKPWFRKRIDEITRQKYAEKQRADEAERRSAEMEARIQKIEQESKQEPPKPATRPERKKFFDEYEDPDDAMAAYAEAVADWKLSDYTAKQQQERQRQQQTQQAQQQEQAFEDKRRKTAEAGQKKYSNWEEVVYSIPEALMPPVLANAIVEMDGGEGVAYYLGNNLDEAERISRMSPYALVAELGKIDARLSKKTNTRAKPPETVSTVRGAKASGRTPDPDKDEESERWIAARNRGEV